VAAKYLEVKEITMSTCTELLKKKLSSYTFWIIKRVARELAIDILTKEVEKWMKHKFGEIVAEDDFVNVDIEDVSTKHIKIKNMLMCFECNLTLDLTVFPLIILRFRN
jgi:hypothetical protein